MTACDRQKVRGNGTNDLWIDSGSGPANCQRQPLWVEMPASRHGLMAAGVERHLSPLSAPSQYA